MRIYSLTMPTMNACLSPTQVDSPKKHGLQPHEIRAELVRNQIKINRLALELGCSSAAIHQVITGDRSNPRIRRAISEKIHLPAEDIWPPEQLKTKEAAAVTTDTRQPASDMRMLVDPDQVAEARKMLEALIKCSGLTLEPFAVAAMAMRAERRAGLAATIREKIMP